MAALPQAHEAPRPQLTSLRLQQRLGQIGTYALLALGGAIILIPLYWMLATSLKADTRLFVLPPQLIPDPVVWRNYLMMAMTVIMSLPILLLYFRAQKYFIEGLTVGGVKG